MSRSADTTVRFVVGSPDGLRAGTWRCWTPGRRKSDVYLGLRSLAGSFKLSLHESGSWHVGFTTSFFSEVLRTGRWRGGSRHVAEFPAPSEIAPGITMAFRIIVPNTAVCIPSNPTTLPPDLVWIPAPPTGRAVEIALLITARPMRPGKWPGRTRMATQPIGAFALADGRHAYLVHRVVGVPRLTKAPGIQGVWTGKESGIRVNAAGRLAPLPEFSRRLERACALVLVNVQGEPAAFMECRVEDTRFGGSREA